MFWSILSSESFLRFGSGQRLILSFWAKQSIPSQCCHSEGALATEESPQFCHSERPFLSFWAERQRSEESPQETLRLRLRVTRKKMTKRCHSFTLLRTASYSVILSEAKNPLRMLSFWPWAEALSLCEGEAKGKNLILFRVSNSEESPQETLRLTPQGDI